ncbi:MAG: carbohydrate kinase family protein [Myxococcota bacterium]|nr:carbohydrate kinase family protein [Myxococcota bacterium]
MPEPSLWKFARAERAGSGLDVVGLGECSLDSVALVDGLPGLGAKVAVADRRELPGGQVATALLALERLGRRTGLICAVGDDAAAQGALEPLREAGMDLAGVRTVPGTRTRSAIVLVDRGSGERTVLGHQPQGLRIPPGEIDAQPIRAARVLHLDASDLDASLEAAEIARSAGTPVVLDADTPVPGIESLLRKVDFPIVSRDFADAYQEGGPARCVRGLVALGARFAVVTLGSNGALGGAAPGMGPDIRSPGFATTVRDTTGAGDVFHAGFIEGLLRGLPAQDVLRVANAAAALACRGVGAQSALPTPDELEALLDDSRVTSLQSA